MTTISQEETCLTPMQGYWRGIIAMARALDPAAAAMDSAVRDNAVSVPRRNTFVEASKVAVWVTSLDVPRQSVKPGRVFSATPILAAKLIIDGTHRRSTPEEIDGWEKEQAESLAAQAANATVVEEQRARVPDLPTARPATKIPASISQSIARLSSKAWNHHRVEAIRLAFYRPTMSDYDSANFWKLSAGQQRKAHNRILDLLRSEPRPGVVKDILEHWAFVLGGMGIGAVGVYVASKVIR